MKIKNNIESEILNILPCIQSDIWKKVKITRKICSKIITDLEKRNIIKRTKAKGKTFMVEKIEKVESKPEMKGFSALLSNSGEFSPCLRCVNECNPINCISLDKWAKT